jgi:hypothetical protein
MVTPFLTISLDFSVEVASGKQRPEKRKGVKNGRIAHPAVFWSGGGPRSFCQASTEAGRSLGRQSQPSCDKHVSICERLTVSYGDS